MLVQPVKLSILQTSKHLHDEITTEIYRNQFLEIEIDVGSDTFLKNAIYARCDSDARIVAEGPEMKFHVLEDADWAKFELIWIQVFPVHMQEPGQILLLRNNMVSLVNKMQKAPQIREVRIDILGGLDMWTKLSNGGYEFLKSDSIRNSRNDVEHVLKPFKLLRGVEVASAQPDEWLEERQRLTWAPRVTDVSDQYKLASEIEKLMMRKSAFGEDESDATILEEHQIMTIELDMALDRLRGNFANMLRLERFKTWSFYEPEMHRLLHQVYPNLSEFRHGKALRALHLRTEAWVYFRSVVNARSSELCAESWEEAFPRGIRRSQFRVREKQITHTWENLIATKADIVAKGVYKYWEATSRYDDVPDNEAEKRALMPTTHLSDETKSLFFTTSKTEKDSSSAAEAAAKHSIEDENFGETIAGRVKRARHSD